ncbi:SDR family oxidoreductase [Spirochaeta dissipatitropha]
MSDFNNTDTDFSATNSKVLVAGATGYLGHAVVQSLKQHGYWVRAIVRTSRQAEEMNERVDEVRIAKVTEPQELLGIADDIDIIFSSIGITRQKDGLTYWDVDYGANKNLLTEALRSGVKKFIYTSVFNADAVLSSKMVYAKELFVKELQVAPIESCVLRPTGFFSDMENYMLETALDNRSIMLIARGRHKLNPISSNDLAEVVTKCIQSSLKEVSVGGPEVYSMFDLAKITYRIVGKKAKLLYVPAWAARIIRKLLVVFTPLSVHGPIEFSLLAGLHDWVAPSTGTENIVEHFEKIAADRIENNAQSG